MLGIDLVKKMVFGETNLPTFKVGAAVQFMYNGEARNVKVERVWNKGNEVYVTGHDYVRNDYRTFKVSKMSPLVGRVFMRRLA